MWAVAAAAAAAYVPPHCARTFASVARSASPTLCWVDETQQLSAQQQQLMQGPSPALAPSEVVSLMLAAFQRGTNEDIEQLFRFVEPTGALASSNLCSAGPMVHFRATVRKEPRWKNIARRPQAAMMHMRSYTIVGCLFEDADTITYRTRCSPFFPDAPAAESEVGFDWHLVRQRAADSRHPELLQGRADCWMVDDIQPKYGDWQVFDPLSAERCPDVFKAPKRIAEDFTVDFSP